MALSIDQLMNILTQTQLNKTTAGMNGNLTGVVGEFAQELEKQKRQAGLTKTATDYAKNIAHEARTLESDIVNQEKKNIDLGDIIMRVNELSLAVDTLVPLRDQFINGFKKLQEMPI